MDCVHINLPTIVGVWKMLGITILDLMSINNIAKGDEYIQIVLVGTYTAKIQTSIILKEACDVIYSLELT